MDRLFKLGIVFGAVVRRQVPPQFMGSLISLDYQCRVRLAMMRSAAVTTACQANTTLKSKKHPRYDWKLSIVINSTSNRPPAGLETLHSGLVLGGYIKRTKSMFLLDFA